MNYLKALTLMPGCVNPDEKLWACDVRSTKEIAMYFPVLLHELRANTNAYVGITFARECVFLDKVPEWAPFRIVTDEEKWLQSDN